MFKRNIECETNIQWPISYTVVQNAPKPNLTSKQFIIKRSVYNCSQLIYNFNSDIVYKYSGEI